MDFELNLLLFKWNSDVLYFEKTQEIVKESLYVAALKTLK